MAAKARSATKLAEHTRDVRLTPSTGTKSSEKGGLSESQNVSLESGTPGEFASGAGLRFELTQVRVGPAAADSAPGRPPPFRGRSRTRRPAA